MGSILQDIRFSFRSLIKNRVFVIVALISIALGLGANTTIFSAVYHILLKSLPYQNPESLVLIWGSTSAKGNENNRNQVSATDIADVRQQNNVFEDVATFTGWMPILSGQGDAERIPGMQVGDGYFKVMQGKPLLGRVFTAEEQQEGKDFVIVLGYRLWQRRFGADPKIIDKHVLLNNRAYTIVGVMPDGFQPLPESLIASGGEFYRPVAEPYDESQRDSRHLRAIARLKRGVSIQKAQSQMDVIANRLTRAHPESNTDRALRVVSLTEDTVGGVRPTLLALFAAVIFVLLVVCANIGNLMIVRASARNTEFTVRVALGASRMQILRQLLIESLLLALGGGFLGAALAYVAIRVASTFAVQINPLFQGITIHFPIFLFTLVISILAGVLFGIAPAVHVWSLDLHESLKEGSSTTTWSAASHRVRNALVILEVALTLIMLISAGLLIQTVLHLRDVDTGFDPHDLLTMNIALPTAKYPEPSNWTAFYLRMIDRLSQLPAVESVAMTSVLPLGDNFDGRGIQIEDHPRPEGQELSADLYVVTADYLRCMRIAVLQGRDLNRHDRADSVPVALINETMVEKLWPGGNAIGKRFRFNSTRNPQWREIVGVVDDVKQYGLDQQPPMQIYLPYPQFPTLFNSIVLRSKTDRLGLTTAVRREIRTLDRDQAIFKVSTMEEWISKSIAIRKFLMVLLVAFAGLALSLATVGIYGVISFTVSQRTHEIGIRMAIGAQQSDVMKLILRHGFLLALTGILSGCVAAIAVTRLMTAFLFHVRPSDPVTFLLVAVMLFSVAILACWFPALRATRISPMNALRYE